jgi:hypothetical protein
MVLEKPLSRIPKKDIFLKEAKYGNNAEHRRRADF